jgi:uncharacterized protein YigE (DUF2233 family)
MKRFLLHVAYRVRTGVITLLGCTSAGVLQAGKAERVEYEGAVYHVYRVNPSAFAKLELRWLGKDGLPLGGFAGLLNEVSGTGGNIAFATNAGIYERGPKPCGLTICGGKEQVPLNLQPGEGNFYLMPNGVFYLDDVRGAGVMTSAEYASSGLRPRLATQSGPVLLRKGQFHPAFNADSPNRRLRNAVGVRTSDGQVVFVMSDRDDREKGRVTFHQISRFFLHLGCQDALFLDGDLSDMIVDPPVDFLAVPNTFAAMFVLLK